MNHKVQQLDILAHTLGLIPYFTYVIIRDLGIDIEAISYAIIACLSILGSKKSFNFNVSSM